MKRSLPALFVLLLAATIALSDPSHGGGGVAKARPKNSVKRLVHAKGKRKHPVAKNATARIPMNAMTGGPPGYGMLCAITEEGGANSCGCGVLCQCSENCHCWPLHNPTTTTGSSTGDTSGNTTGTDAGDTTSGSNAGTTSGDTTGTDAGGADSGGSNAGAVTGGSDTAGTDSGTSSGSNTGFTGGSTNGGGLNSGGTTGGSWPPIDPPVYPTTGGTTTGTSGSTGGGASWDVSADGIGVEDTPPEGT